MSVSRQLANAGQKHVYRLPLSILYLPGGMLLFAYLLAAVLIQPLSGLSILIAGVTFVGSLALVAAVLFIPTRLETTPEGIAYYAPGYRVRTSWENVWGIGRVVQGGRQVEAVLLESDALEISWWLRIGLALRPFTGYSVDMTEYSHVIPVGYFKPDWEGGRLKEDVCCYAPQAFILTSELRELGALPLLNHLQIQLHQRHHVQGEASGGGLSAPAVQHTDQPGA